MAEVLDIFEGGEAVAPDQVRARIDELLAPSRVFKGDKIDHIRDSSWVRESIMASPMEFEEIDEMRRMWSTADRKYTDSTLGGNFTINPRPQFTRYADVRSPGLLAGRNRVSLGSNMGNIGMGLYYSEAIDDTSQTIHMRMGHAQHNSLTNFFTSFFDYSMARQARSGRLSETIFYYMSYSVATAGRIILSIAFWPVWLYAQALDLIRLAMNRPISKFYNSRPAMHNYWSAVGSMINRIAVYRHMFPWSMNTAPLKTDTQNFASGPNQAAVGKMSAEEISRLSSMLPFYTSTGYIDIFKVANRAQRIANKLKAEINERKDKSTEEEFMKYMADWRQDWRDGSGTKISLGDLQYAKNSTFELVKKYKGTAVGGSAGDDGQTAKDSGTEVNYKTPRTKGEQPTEEPSGLFDYYKAEAQDGGAFATFRVDATGPVDESFSSTTVESDISSKFNSLSAQGRAASFTFANGNIDGGILNEVMGAVQGLVGGTLQGLGLSGIMAAAGAAFVDIPEHWDNSAANLSKMSYTMQLVSPYANPMSQMLNLYIPLCMLLAAALPISTGKQSYGSPFLIELFDQGKAQTRLGIMQDLTIVRGTTNLGFNRAKEALAIDVSFTIKDLSPILHMPIQSGFSLNPLKGITDEDTVFTDYMNTLASATIGENLYLGNKIKLRAINKFREFQALLSPARWAMVAHDSPLSILDFLAHDTERI